MFNKIKYFLVAAIAGISNYAFADQSNSKVKSCLASIYLAQDNFHRINRRYAQAREELTQVNACTGFVLSADYADKNEFKFVAKSNTQAWTVDDSKNIEEADSANIQN